MTMIVCFAIIVLIGFVFLFWYLKRGSLADTPRKSWWHAAIAVAALFVCAVGLLSMMFAIIADDLKPSEWRRTLRQEEKLRVGFDLDGTLVFSRPTFTLAFAQTKPLSPECYALVNGSDELYSKIRTPVKKILDKHRTRGDEIFVVTSRGPQNGDKLKAYLNFNFGIPAQNVFFSPDDKTEVLKELDLDIFYGDFDLDITSAQNAGAVPYRILLGEAEYQKPEKYNPGKFGEAIIAGTEWVEPGKEDWNASVGENEERGNPFLADLFIWLLAGMYGAVAVGTWLWLKFSEKKKVVFLGGKQRPE